MKPAPAAARFVRRARRELSARYGRVMEVCLGPMWDDDWIDEAATQPGDLAAIAGLTDEQWRHRTDKAFALFTDRRRRFDPGKWNRYVHAVALRLQARAVRLAQEAT